MNVDPSRSRDDRPAPPAPTARGPVRTCVGCKRRDDKAELVRFAIHRTDAGVHLVPDVRGRLPGRGVHVHARRDCFERAAKRGGFARAVRSPVSVDPEVLAAQTAEQLMRRVEGLVGAAVRGRHAALGTDAVRDAVRADALSILVIARDAAGRRDELIADAGRLGRPAVVLDRDKGALGRLAGRGELAVLALLDDGIGDEVLRAVACAKELGMPSVDLVNAADRADASSSEAAGRNE